MNNLKNNRIVKAFAELRSAGRKTVLPFVTAGYPDLETTEALLKDFETRGVRVCELGVPFSDPVADGPIIQASYTEALARGVRTPGILAMVRRYRDGGGSLALIAMISYSIVFRHGVEQFVADAAAAGLDGLIVPDLPLEEAARLEGVMTAQGLANIMLIAPTSDETRRLEIARHSRGFIYHISVAGITGERTKLPPQTVEAVAELRKHTATPVCVGFGISSAQTVRTVLSSADGAIVGSAIVHRIHDAMDQGLPRGALVEKVGQFVDTLMEGTQGV